MFADFHGIFSEPILQSKQIYDLTVQNFDTMLLSSNLVLFKFAQQFKLLVLFLQLREYIVFLKSYIVFFKSFCFLTLPLLNELILLFILLILVSNQPFVMRFYAFFLLFYFSPQYVQLFLEILALFISLVKFSLDSALFAILCQIILLLHHQLTSLDKLILAINLFIKLFQLLPLLDVKVLIIDRLDLFTLHIQNYQHTFSIVFILVLRIVFCFYKKQFLCFCYHKVLCSFLQVVESDSFCFGFIVYSIFRKLFNPNQSINNKHTIVMSKIIQIIKKHSIFSIQNIYNPFCLPLQKSNQKLICIILQESNHIQLHLKFIMQNRSTKSYESYIQCLGNICGFCCCTYKRIQTSTLGMRERFGQFKDTVTPGLTYYNPLTQDIKQISLKTTVINMPQQSVYTKDNMSVFIDTALFYRIIDPFKSTYIVKDLISSLMQITFVTLRTICGQYILQDLLLKRQQVNEKIQEFVSKQAKDWGVYIEYLLIKDMRLSQFLSQNLSKVSTTKRLVQSKIISAKADLQSAMLYRSAADILDIKAAVQIRFLQTLEQMQAMKSSKITIIPLQPEYE